MSNINTFKIILIWKKNQHLWKMGPTHNNKNGPGGPKKGGSVKITTPVPIGSFSFHVIPQQNVDVAAKN